MRFPYDVKQLSSVVKIQLFNDKKMNWPSGSSSGADSLSKFVHVPHFSSLKTAAPAPGPSMVL